MRCSAALLAMLLPTTLRAADSFQYNRDVRPILSAHCFKCHGPDDATREADLRFDQREVAIGPAASGTAAIVPGKPDESELIKRISSDDHELLMPPPAANKPLSDAQKQTLRDWIAAGAAYESHWSFTPPVEPPLPTVKQSAWPRSPLDQFVLARLEQAGLAPSPEADKYTLARRVSLDLIGLPPTPEEIEAFVNDSSPGAYEALVDRLLASRHYGERWARRWLDLARYADTNGYEKDRQRSIWPFRDWVIAALNADMPFDQFTIEQLAGDMLPGVTPAQRIATGFHRNTMLNEEGGVDPLEFRFHAMVDRVATTATVWLGLTIGCAQCHTHKFDPVTHHDYYRLMALLNNADEPEFAVPDADITARRDKIEAEITAIERDMANRFPLEGEYRWHDASLVSCAIESGAKHEQLADGSFRISGPVPDRDTYALVIDGPAADISALQLEVLADPQLPSKGPGRTPHGNFVLTEFAATVAPAAKTDQPDHPEQSRSVTFAGATADFAQDGFAIERTFDNNATTGWAIHGPGDWNVNRTATFRLTEPVKGATAQRWAIRLDQQYGGNHTIGRFRVRLGEKLVDDRPEAERRREHLERKFAAWLAAEAATAVRWTALQPVAAHSEIPSLTVLDDRSILASGDMSKRDEYQVALANVLPRVTALRLEVLPDEGLPRRGPGRIAYEGPFGDFFLSEVTLRIGEQPLKITAATHSFANGHNTAAASIDGDPQTGWSIDGGQGRAHVAVFQLAEPLTGATQLDLKLLFERYYAAGLGRFRVSVTDDPRPVAAHSTPTDIEALALKPAAERTADEQSRLLTHYLSVAPELSAEHATIRKLRESLPAFFSTLVMQERPAEHPRATHLHKRGEYLQPAEQVEPQLPSLFPPLGADEPHDRLTLARWLASPRNPLVARVTVNRHWAAIFGRGLVRTTEDFGYQGEPPTHPELLDWLALEFMRQNWSVKQLHKLIVTSATYRQSSRVSPELLERDPQNKLLARAPRVRLDAELVRDAVLRFSGLLTDKLGGPSVFPPQPAGVTSEGTYGPLAWKVSEGADRYRRGLYTFSKRTAPYAMFLAFDAPSGEACLARREVSNTPLQALTLLNDPVFVEAAQALGKRLAADPAGDGDKLDQLFTRCVSRHPTASERDALLAFHTANAGRLARGELDAAQIAGGDAEKLPARAVWTLTARAVMNLDETITKE
ncbi:MAG: PSD1 and planctomycete cytochrome C domain-containing protein [Pirellulales bacterium]|nr:PSD1 and planctomycete cytochrome C domain-containing protein [Pirellulales bacterium]